MGAPFKPRESVVFYWGAKIISIGEHRICGHRVNLSAVSLQYGPPFKPRESVVYWYLNAGINCVLNEFFACNRSIFSLKEGLSHTPVRIYLSKAA